jgi:Ca-activated chloride channel homolog
MRARVPVLLVLVCLATALMAAQERGVIVVDVKDASGAAIPGATVMIARAESNTDFRKCISDQRGVCSFAGVLPGTYRVQAELSGFRPSLQLVDLTAGQTLRLSSILEVSMLQETITVSGATPIMDTSTSAPPLRPVGSPAAMAMSGIVGGVAGGVAGYLSEPYHRHERANTEAYDDAGDNAFRSVSADPLSTFSIDVDTASYANVRRFLTEGTLPPDAAVRIEELINYFDYSYPQPNGDQPFSITTELAACPWNSKHRLALIGLQGRDIDHKELPARNLVFLVDVSGSMMTPDKLPLVQHGLRMLADTLNANDRVSIVVYAGASGLVLPPTNGNRKERIDRAIADLQAGGSTNGGAGIQLAYQTARDSFIKGGVNRVILATDGDFNVGVTDQAELVRLIERERESGVFLSVLGVGTGNLKDSTMEKLADKGNGNYSYLDSMHEAHRVLVKEAGSTLVTIAKDVKIQVEFNPRAVSSYRLIGYENRMLKNQDFNDDRKDAGEIGAGHNVTAIYEIVPAGTAPERPGVDPLKYGPQPASPQPPAVSGGKYDGELLTVKLRYKAPDGELSKLASAVIADRPQAIGGNLGFASAVAEAGMLLRHSPHARDASFASAIERARTFRGDDGEGYRAEFIRLMEIASSLSKRSLTNR